MATWRRVTGVAGLAAGAVAAGAGVVVAAERIAIGRTQVLRSTTAPEGLGQLRGQPLTVLADDGVSLHVEIDEPPAGTQARLGRAAPAAHRHLLPRLHAEPGLLALPAGRPAASTVSCSGTSGTTAGPGGPRRARPASTGSAPTWT